MFGYVKAYKPELKVRDYEQYKAVYCSLCKTLGREYGLFARLTLSYDFTFAALLRLYGASDSPDPARVFTNLVARSTRLQNATPAPAARAIFPLRRPRR